MELDPIFTVRQIATTVRHIVEIVSKSLYHPLGSFPNGWCDDCSRALGAVLDERGEHGFKRVVGRRGEHNEKTHVWLQRGDLIVDITADQFRDEVCSPVIVTTDRSWHVCWEQTIEDLDEIDHTRFEGELYRAIVGSDAWRSRQVNAPTW